MLRRFPLPFPAASGFRWRAWLAGVFLLGLPDADAVLLYDSADPNANIAAPTGIYADSGWGFMGQYGSFLGTMIGPQYFITAQHIGTQGGTFVSTAAFNGSSDVTYTIDSAANGGIGYWDLPGTDLRILKINETFSGYATLYTGTGEVGLDLVVFGRGGPRGAGVTLGPDAKGWLHTPSDGVARWGANEVSSIESSGVGDLLTAQFNAIAGQQEATLSVGDSGGAVFVQSGGQWFLAGVNYAVDGLFDTNNTVGDASEFNAGLFDMGGFYIGTDGTGWTFIPDDAADVPAQFYASRISSNAAAIQAITGVPEPGAAWLIMIAAIIALRRRVRSAARARCVTQPC